MKKLNYFDIVARCEVMPTKYEYAKTNYQIWCKNDKCKSCLRIKIEYIEIFRLSCSVSFLFPSEPLFIVNRKRNYRILKLSFTNPKLTVLKDFYYNFN